MRSQGGTRSVVAVVVPVQATCTSQSHGQALAVADDYLCLCAHQIRIRTWSFVLKQRGLCHEGGEEVRENTPIPLPYLALGCGAKQSPARYRGTTPLSTASTFSLQSTFLRVYHRLVFTLYPSSTVNVEYSSHLYTDITSMR